jgi:hypothetical protein
MITSAMAPWTIVVIILKYDINRGWGQDEWTRRLKNVFSIIDIKTVEYKTSGVVESNTKAHYLRQVRLLIGRA